MTTMNYSTAIFLDETSKVRAIAVTYEDILTDTDTTKMMDYDPGYLNAGKLPAGAKIKKTLDESIKVGDFVVVPTTTRHKMAVCKVVAVDVDVDFDSQAECHWVVSKVDTVQFEACRQQEELVVKAIRKGVVDKKRKETSEAFRVGLGDIKLPQITGFVDTADENVGNADGPGDTSE